MWRNPCTDEGRRLDFAHLGGTSTGGDRGTWYPALWLWLCEIADARSMLDVGCGVGFAQLFFHRAGVTTFGTDCEQMRPWHLVPSGFIAADMTQAAVKLPEPADVVWCCEVAEHIAEEKSEHLLETLSANTGKVLAFCAALPRAHGHHHVNCREPGYWIERMVGTGMTYDHRMTELARSLAAPHLNGRGRDYFGRSGLVFRR